MKKIIILASLIMWLPAISQTVPPKKYQAHKRTISVEPEYGAVLRTKDSGISYISSSSNSAYGFSHTRDTSLVISDPTLIALKERAEGYNVKVGKSGIVGMPKHNYGFSDGHIIFHTNNATSSGTTTGSGAVGTGSSPGIMTSSGPGTGLNGKSPYVGTGEFGYSLPAPQVLYQHSGSKKRGLAKKYN